MPAENRQRRKTTAREAAERFGVSTRTIRRVTAEPRAEFLARAKTRREQAARLRNEGKSYVDIAAEMGCSTGSVGRLLHDARKYGIPVRESRVVMQSCSIDYMTTRRDDPCASQ